ncbi:MAG: methionine adenosyltransferase, partial [candidate division Zixibacteria bacterium]|nr:methionine adenosyltransferase [candidate division Zixibacteria bacterium]
KSRVACETFITVGLVIVGGEITTSGYADVAGIARKVVREIGYTDSKYGFNYETCAVLNAIGEQSLDISRGVDTGGAGDQGIMFGHACNDSEELMPLPIALAHKLTMNLSVCRKDKTVPYLGPDGKSQVSIVYEEGKARHIESVVLSTQHTERALNSDKSKIREDARQEIIDKVIKPILPPDLVNEKTRYYINPTGIFLIGGPQSDTGMTGRKIIVDTYGGWAPHGGGAFSGKDPTKVDRSASYMARYIAKNIVAAGLAETCTIQLAYAIGVEQPVSIAIDTEDSGQLDDQRLEELVRLNFDLTPRGIINTLDLLRPIYKKTAAYGHFGRNEPEFTWENTDRADEMKSWS